MSLNVKQYHDLRNCIFKDLVACGVTDDSDENFKAFGDVLGNKLDVNWNDDGSGEDSVRCNNCMWQGVEDELKTVVDLEGNDHDHEVQYLRGCPNCETDEYLTDLN